MQRDLELRPLAANDRAAFDAAIREFATTDPDWEFAFGYAPGDDFLAYVERLARESRGEDVPDNWVPSTQLVAVVGGTIVGRLSLRHELNDALRNYGGHVGFGVVPSARRRGYATAMLRGAFPLAREVGIDRMLVTCADTNIGSRTVIERCGGVFADVRPRDDGDGDLTRRYWIDLS